MRRKFEQTLQGSAFDNALKDLQTQFQINNLTVKEIKPNIYATQVHLGDGRKLLALIYKEDAYNTFLAKKAELEVESTIDDLTVQNYLNISPFNLN